MKGLPMNVYLLKDIEKVGIAGEIVRVSEGYAMNFVIPRKLGVEVTKENEGFYKNKQKTVENRKEVIESKTSILAERIKTVRVTIKKKSHDDGKLYGAINAQDIVDALAEKGVSISKNQVDFGKSIKEKGEYKITIKLSSKLQPQVTVVVTPA
jgi:large subunit ribosomal protein L9